MQILGKIYSSYIWHLGAAKALGQIIMGAGAIMATLGLAWLFAPLAYGTLPAIEDPRAYRDMIMTVSAIYVVALGVPIGWGVHQIVTAFPALTRKFTDAPGNARLGTMKDLKEAGLVGGSLMSKQRGQDIYCGMMNKTPVFYSGDRHIITVGPTRSGKDTGLLVQNLRHLRRSIVVIDPKAELAAITSRFRRTLGPVLIINPFEVETAARPDLRSNGFNPLVSNFQPGDRRFFAKAMGFGEAIIAIEGHDPHWTRSARSLVTAAIMRTKYLELERKIKVATIGHVNTMLTSPYKTKKKDQASLQGIVEEISAHQYQPMAQLARNFLEDTDEKTRDDIRSVVSTLLGQIPFLSDDALSGDMDRHPTLNGKVFDFEMMKHQIVTVYVILPDDMLSTYAVWLRIVIASALNALKLSAPGRIRPVLMLNEVGNLGYLEPLDIGMSMAAGKGVTIWTAFQSKLQIDKLYGGSATFMGGAGVFNAFPPGRDLDTARYICESSGERTEVVTSYTSSPKAKRPDKQEAPSGFPVLRVDEVCGRKARTLFSQIEPSPYMFELQAPGYWQLGMSGLDKNPFHVEKVRA